MPYARPRNIARKQYEEVDADGAPPAWILGTLDLEFPRPAPIDRPDALLVLHRILRWYESKTWAEIEHAAHCHPARPDELTDEAQDRLVKIERDDVAELFQIAGQADGDESVRIFGVRTGPLFEIVWIDLEHRVWKGGDTS